MKDLVLYYPAGHQEHYEIGHPERPERVETIWKAIQSMIGFDLARQVDPISLNSEVLQAIHTDDHLQRIEIASQHGRHLDPDTYVTHATAQLARQVAGGAAAVAQEVWSGRSRRGFALTRPPGHHATSNRAMGFCLMNNVALAAQYLLGQSGASRLAIVDLDLHHGNGTQEIFYNRGEVFYLSTHQYPFYPGTGHLEETGAGAGVRTTANFPLPPYTGDQGFEALMDMLIIPVLAAYEPEMILVSAGFDAHWRDPLGQLLLSAGRYGDLITALTEWSDVHCQGRIALFLEGGYDLEAASACALASVSALCGLDFRDTIGAAPMAETSRWMQVIDRARQLWELK